MPLSTTRIEPIANLRRRRHLLLVAATVLGTSLVACGRQPAEPAEQATAAKPPTAAPTVIKRSVPPLPAPGQSGVFARQGGLVANGGAMNFELVVVDGVARVYLYDESGHVAGPRDCRATLTVDAGKSHELERKMEGLTVWMEGGSGLPASFDARLVMAFDTKEYDVSLRYASSGSSESSGSSAGAAGAATTDSAAGTPATRPTAP